jgi:NAD(P)-dependent dehydrogenase (short-subunit alcohol dehydrogenase family)
MPTRTVLITGCSTGIGRDLAQRLAHAGSTVIATARRPETLADLPVALALPLDVTDPASVATATEEVIRRFGRIDVLVNNAGYALRGALEEVPVEDAQALFDVNVFGVLRMIRTVVPQMRRQGSGRIITISSIAGKCSTPGSGPYSATKFAVEALSDALRWELAPFGIQVVIIEPGSISTPFAATAQAHARTILANASSPYHALYARSAAVAASMRQQGAGPEAVSKVIQQAIEAARPRRRYLVAIPFSGWLVLRLGHGAWDLVVRRLYEIAPAGRRPEAAREESRPPMPAHI